MLMNFLRFFWASITASVEPIMFDGKATHDNHVLIGEDISAIMRMIAPTQTPFLDLLPPPDKPATNTLHQWTEENLGPDRVTLGAAMNSATAATGLTLSGLGHLLSVGMLLELEVASGNQEIVQVSSVVGANSVLVTRNYGARGVNSLVSGGTLFVISTAELEGSETSGDKTRARTRRNNFTQIFKKPIAITGTDQAVITAPDVGSEFGHQTTLRAMELARDLEKAIFRGVRSGSSIGSDTAYRSMDGLRQYITDINSTVATSSFSNNPEGYINDMLQQAWNTGARDINVIAVGAQWAREISEANGGSLQISQQDRGIERLVEYIRTDFGLVRKVLTPWLPDRHMMGVATNRVSVVPLRGRSFFQELLGKTGDSNKGHVIGEYTMEAHHPDKMFQLRTSG